MAISASTNFQIFYVGASKQLSAITSPQEGALYVQGNQVFLYNNSAFSALSGLSVGNTAPINAVAGSEWIDTSDGKNLFKVYNGSEWIVSSVEKLATARSFSIKGGATAAGVSFDGTGNVELEVTQIAADKIVGTIPSSVTVPYESGTSAIASEDWVEEKIADAAVQVMHYKGNLADTDALEAVSTHNIGDVYNLADGSNYAYTELASGSTPGGTEGVDYIVAGGSAASGMVGYWEKLAASIDLSGYVTLADAQTISGTKTFADGSSFASTGAVLANTATIATKEAISVNTDLGIATKGAVVDYVDSANAGSAKKLDHNVTISISGGATGTATASDLSGSTLDIAVSELAPSSLVVGTITDGVKAVTQAAGSGSATDGSEKAIATVEYVDDAVDEFASNGTFSGTIDSTAVATTQDPQTGLLETGAEKAVATVEYVDDAIAAAVLVWNVID